MPRIYPTIHLPSPELACAAFIAHGNKVYRNTAAPKDAPILLKIIPVPQR